MPSSDAQEKPPGRTPAELVHVMMIHFNPHVVSKDRHGYPDEYDTLWLQSDEYTNAAQELDRCLQEKADG